MRRMMFGIAAAVVLAATSLWTDTRPAEAEIIYPWCAQNNGRLGGAPTCGFVSFEQCMQTVRGLQGTCAMNPFYEPPPAYARPRAKQHRVDR